MEAAIHEKVDLRCCTTAAGEASVEVDSTTQQQESFATCSVSDTSENHRETATYMALDLDQFGSANSGAMERKRTSPSAAGALVVTVFLAKKKPSHALQMTQLHCLEAKVHAKDVLKCIMTIDGEPFVMTDSLTLQQESFATLWDSETLDER